MRKRIVFALLVTVWSLTGVLSAHATGFSIYEAGTRATALGGAFTATADDGSAMFYNASGLSFLEGNAVEVNVMAIAPRFKFAEAQSLSSGDPATGKDVENNFLVPGVYYTRNTGQTVAWGVGVYAPFGLGVEWQDPNEWVGRQASYDVAIQTVYITPAASFRLSEQFAVAVGLDVATQHLELNRLSLDPTTGSNAIDQNIKGTSSVNLTPSFGAMYRPTEKWSFGLMYHFKKTMKYDDGDLKLKNVAQAGTPAETFASTLLGNLGGNPNQLDTKIKSELNLPWIMSIGGAYSFIPELKLEVNYVRFGWSEFQSLELNTPIDALNQTLEFNYEDSWQLRAGLEYDLNEKWNLMAGYVRDNTPQPLASVSPILPDSDRNDYSLGLGFKTGSWKFHAAYMAVIGEERTNIENGRSAAGSETYPTGTYKSLANIFGVAAGYYF